MPEHVTIRPAHPGDALALARLATLDDKPVPVGKVLLAEVRGEPWAAFEVAGGAHVADPFRPSGELVELLRVRAELLQGERSPRRAGLLRRRRRALRIA